MRDTHLDVLQVAVKRRSRSIRCCGLLAVIGDWHEIETDETPDDLAVDVLSFPFEGQMPGEVLREPLF